MPPHFPVTVPAPALTYICRVSRDAPGTKQMLPLMTIVCYPCCMPCYLCRLRGAEEPGRMNGGRLEGGPLKLVIPPTLPPYGEPYS